MLIKKLDITPRKNKIEITSFRHSPVIFTDKNTTLIYGIEFNEITLPEICADMNNLEFIQYCEKKDLQTKLQAELPKQEINQQSIKPRKFKL